MSLKIIGADQMMALLKKHHFKGIKEMLAEAPEILRCKDCVNCLRLEQNGYRPMCADRMLYVKDDDYCSFGERKDDELPRNN